MAVGDIVGYVILKLLSDLRELSQLLGGNSNLARRLKPFVIFSSLEASSWLLVFALQQEIRSGNFGQLSVDNRAAIMGLTFRVDKSGLLKEYYSRMPVPDLLLFVLRSLGAFRGNADFDPRHCQCWNEVENVNKLRNRVAHPKGIKEIDREPTDAELSDCEKAWVWLLDAIQQANGPDASVTADLWKASDWLPRTVTFGPEGIVVTDSSSTSPPHNEESA
jgi:hypothetical protein